LQNKKSTNRVFLFFKTNNVKNVFYIYETQNKMKNTVTNILFSLISLPRICVITSQWSLSSQSPGKYW